MQKKMKRIMQDIKTDYSCPITLRRNESKVPELGSMRIKHADDHYAEPFISNMAES
jgi:hypothetical protein